MARVVLCTFGSKGDLNPYIAMGVVLRDAGHEITLVTHAHYQEVAERERFRFIPVKPGQEELGPEAAWAHKVNDRRRGAQFIINELLMPYLQHSYDVMREAATGADLIISHVMTLAAPIVAEKLRIPWLSVALQPSILLSAYDPPALGPLPFLPRLKFLGPIFFRPFFGLARRSMNSWFGPVHQLRQQLGLPAGPRNLLLDGHSPFGTLVLFPESFAQPQRDWPQPYRQIGFPLYDEDELSHLSPELEQFLQRGPAPVVFTLGTAVVLMQTRFFDMAYDAVRKAGCRAVFLIGKKGHDVPEAARLDRSFHLSPYEPYSQLFPRCHAIVHQCGIGTTSQALTSGRPELLVPFAHDQFDNAQRVTRMGIGVDLPAYRLNGTRLSRALDQLLNQPRFMQAAQNRRSDFENRQFPEKLLRAIQELVPGTVKN